jgi:hypothetical protein
MSKELSVLNNIKSKIHTIRGKQVLFDRDLAKLYGVETKNLNKAVNRNKERFPKDFMFQLTIEELENLRFQFGTSRWGGRRYSPYVFTEQGVSMLSSVLKSKKAVDVNINIMRAFVAVRKFLIDNKDLFSKVNIIESKILEHDDKITTIFEVLEKEKLPEKGIFFDGQIFDAFKLASDLIKSANNQIILIDNYVDENTLHLLSKKKKDVSIIIHTKNITTSLKQDIKKFNEQYKNLELKEFKQSHDRFLIIDEEIYHIGASLKDLGKKWFAFSKLNMDINIILSKLKEN